MNHDEPINSQRPRESELRELLAAPDSYELIVRFTRSVGDDMNCGGDPIVKADKPLGQALLQQFVNELQEAYDQTGMAGSFEVVAGPSICLGYHGSSKYDPIPTSKGDDNLAGHVDKLPPR